MKSQNSDFWLHRKVRNIERRILNTINVYNGAKISAKICKILQKGFLHTYFCSTVYVDGIQNSPLNVLYVPMKKKMAFLQIHFLHLSLTSQEKVKEIWNLKIRIFDFIGRCETLRGEFWIPSTYTMEQKLVQKYAKYCKNGFCTPIFARPYTLMVFKILLSTFRTFLWKKNGIFANSFFAPLLD